MNMLSMRRLQLFALTVMLMLSMMLNVYYLHINNYNRNVLNQVLETVKTTERNKFLATSRSCDNESIPSGPALKNPLYWKYFKQVFIQTSNDLDKEQFTIIMMTYQRPTLLRKLIPHYCRTGRYLNKILLIWNDVGGIIPKDILNHECDVPLKIILPPENKLTNRFFPYSEIETDAIFTIDDDRLVLHEDLVFAFQSWQQYRHRILGYEYRTHTILPNGTYFYGIKKESDASLGYSLLISANFILHKAYLEMYNMPEFLNPSILDYVDKWMNCEDLAMCLMVADFLAKVTYPQVSCVGLKAKHYPYNLEAQNNGPHKGLSIRPTHVNGRTRCLNEFKAYYSKEILPIHYSNVKFIHEPETYYNEN